MQNILDRIIKTSINLLVFLLPLFFLSFSYEAFEFNKQYLLFFLVTLGFLAWLVKMVFIDKEIKFKRTFLDIPILAILLVVILSTIFSADKLSSLFGSYGRFSEGLIGFSCLAIFYFLIVNNSVKVFSLIKSFIWSGSVAILFGYLSIFGFWAKISGGLHIALPQIMLNRSFNLVSGSTEGFAIFISIFLVFLFGILLTRDMADKTKKIFYWLALIFGLGLLLVIDSSSAWIVMLVSSLVFVAFSLAGKIFKENVNKLLLPVFLAIIAAIFLIISVPREINKPFTADVWFTIPTPENEVILSQSQSWVISSKTLIDSPKNIFLGSGPGTFSLDFSKFKSADFNMTDIWQYTLDRAGNSFAEILATTGILGLLSYLGLIGFFLMISYRFFKEKSQVQEIKRYFPFFAVLVGLLAGQFVYYQNTVLSFIFWFILALSVLSLQKEFKESKYSFRESPEKGLFFGVATIVVIAGFLGLYFFATRFYLADAAYLKALVSTDVKNSEKAVSLNPYRAQYKILLSRFYLSQSLSGLAELEKPTDQQDAQKIQDGAAKATKAIDLARIATEIYENNVAVWENRALLYREFQGFISGSSDWAVTSFKKAIDLEPTNPFFHTELGKLLLESNKEEAKKEFEKALKLKSNYSDAVIQQALIFESEGKTDEEINILETQVIANPYDTDSLFQLGRVYYNNERTEEAILAFNQIVLIYPDHSNAHYALGVVFSERGEKTQAIAEFKKVLELNPGNQDVIDKIKSLEE